MSIYAFQATLENSETYSLERYRGKPSLSSTRRQNAD